MPGRARILYVNHASRMAGAERSLIRILDHMDRDRFQPFLACPEGDLAREAELRDTKVFLVNFINYQKNRSNLFGTVVPNPILGAIHAVVVTMIGQRLKRIVARNRIDIIHANTLLARFPAYLAGRFAGVPAIWHVRDILSPGLWLSIYDRLARSGLAHIITVSNACRRQFSDQSIISTAYDGISVDVFHRDPAQASVARRQFGWEDSAIAFGIFGRISPTKGHGLFVDAAVMVHRRYPSTRWLIVGEAWTDQEKEFQSSIDRRAVAGGLGDHLVFTGFRDDVNVLMSACDIIVVPSIIQDSFPNTALEGMACSRVVLAFPVGGVPEAIEDGISGKLVACMDAEGLAQSMVELIENPSERIKLGENGRRRVVENFTPEKTQRAIEHVYDVVLGRTSL